MWQKNELYGSGIVFMIIHFGKSILVSREIYFFNQPISKRVIFLKSLFHQKSQAELPIQINSARLSTILSIDFSSIGPSRPFEIY